MRRAFSGNSWYNILRYLSRYRTQKPQKRIPNEFALQGPYCYMSPAKQGRIPRLSPPSFHREKTIRLGRHLLQRTLHEMHNIRYPPAKFNTLPLFLAAKTSDENYSGMPEVPCNPITPQGILSRQQSIAPLLSSPQLRPVLADTLQT